MTYDRAAIMKAAWVIVRRADTARHGLRLVLRNALRTAWKNAKDAAREARWAAEAALKAAKPQSAADRIRATIWALECKDRLFAADWQRLDTLREQLRDAQPAAV